MVTTTPLIIEQHIHGAFGVDFNTASVNDVLKVAKGLVNHGVGGFFPTLVTDSVENIKRQIQIIKEASKQIGDNSAKIFGIHLEGIFINALKCGIHDKFYFLEPNINNYKLIEDDFIKIVTLAPELDNGLIAYLKEKNVKVQAGHCVGDNLTDVNAVTHIFNAMSGVAHRGKSTALSALVNDKIYTEIIADGVHVNDDALRLLFKSKPKDKIILISDALPITYSDLKECVFAGSKIYYNGVNATSSDGTIAGSTVLVDEVVRRLAEKNLFDAEYIINSYKYHNIEPFGEIIWNDEWKIIDVKL